MGAPLLHEGLWLVCVIRLEDVHVTGYGFIVVCNSVYRPCKSRKYACMVCSAAVYFQLQKCRIFKKISTFGFHLYMSYIKLNGVFSLFKVHDDMSQI